MLLVPEEGLDTHTLDRLEVIFDDCRVLETEIVLQQWGRALTIEAAIKFRQPITFE
jgi:hypothetical protein